VNLRTEFCNLRAKSILWSRGAEVPQVNRAREFVWPNFPNSAKKTNRINGAVTEVSTTLLLPRQSQSEASGAPARFRVSQQARDRTLR
jgi:hypothetical protein